MVQASIKDLEFQKSYAYKIESTDINSHDIDYVE